MVCPYTSFAYSDLKLTKSGDGFTATFKIKNTGKTKGSEIAQLYVSQESPSIPRPVKELKGFSKIELAPGQSKEVTIKLPLSAFSYYNDLQNKWVAEKGNFTILVGSSSKDIRLQAKISR
jgi:beta-glucosidase